MAPTEGRMMAGPNVHLPHGTQVLLRRPIGDHCAGAAGVVIRGGPHRYSIGFPDGREQDALRDDLTILRLHQKDVFEPDSNFHRYEHRIAYLAVVGSHAYGLSTTESDRDLRGFYIAEMDDLFSLRGIPDTVEGPGDIAIWELKKFIHLVLNANPNVLETAFSPLIVRSSEPARYLLSHRHVFLSKRVYVTYQGYAMSQFKKLEQDLRSGGEIRWKHAMHLLRLLLSGAHLLATGEPLIDVGNAWREPLLEVRHGTWAWEKVDALRLRLHAEFEQAHANSALPADPDYGQANEILVSMRRASL